MTSERRESLIPQATSVTRRILRFMWRWTRRGLKTLGILIALVLTLLAVLQLTDPGRAFVLRNALEQTNQLIPGRIEAKRLGRLSIFGLELWGVEVFDPNEKSVATLGHISIETNVSGLLSGKIALNLVKLEDAEIDLRVLEERSGLIAAFSDPDAEPSPPSDSPPPNILVEQISLKQVRARLPEQDPVGQIDVTVEGLDARFAFIGGEAEVNLRHLKASATRDAEQLLAVLAEGRLPRGASPARLKLDAESGPILLKLDAESVLPTQEGWEKQPLRASVSLTGVSADHIAYVLRDKEMQNLFLGEVALRLDASGNANDLEVDGTVSTAGGDLSIDQLRARDDVFDATLSTQGLDLARIRADLPQRRVEAQVTAQVKGLPPDPVEASLSIREARLDGQALLDVDASGTWTGTRAEGLKLVATDGESRIEATGDATPGAEAELALRVDLRPELVSRLSELVEQDISARITANATVSLNGSGEVVAGGTAQVDDLVRRTGKAEEQLTARSVELTFDARGEPPNLRGRLDAQVRDVSLGDQVIDQGTLSVHGSAASADVKLTASGGQGKVVGNRGRSEEKQVELHLDVHVERQGTQTTLTGAGEGKLMGDKVSFKLKETRVSDQGAIQTDGIALKLAGQEVRVQGALSPSGESKGLRLDFGPINLAEVPRVIGINPHIVGIVSGHALVLGSTSIPRVKLTAQASGLGLQRRPLTDVELTADFDAEAGNGAVTVELSSPQGLAATVSAQASFRGGANYIKALPLAEGEAELKLSKLETDFVNPYLPPGSLLFDAGVTSRIQVRGSAAKPELEGKTRLELRIDEKENVLLEHQINFGEGKLQTELSVSDRLGAWIEFVARLDLQSPQLGVAELGPAFARAASEAAWELNLDAKPRLLNELSLASLFTNVSALPPFSTELDFSATHGPGQEPEATLHLNAKQARDWKLGDCPATGIVFKVEATHRGEANVLEVRGLQKQQELLLLSAEVPLALKPVLEQNAVQLGALNVKLQTEKLKLESLPFVCGHAQGELTLALDGQDVLGKHPTLSADLNARALSLGSRETLDLSLEARADSDSVKTDLIIQGRGERQDAHGKVDIKLPWKWSEGKVEVEENSPFEANILLQKLPIAPLLPPRGALSYARGTIDGELKAQGRLRSPQLHGHIQLNELAFTSTSLAQPLRGINSRIKLEGRKVMVEHFEAHDRDGVLTLSGEVNLADIERVHGKIDISAKDFPLRQQGQVVAVTNLEAVAESTVTPTETQATLTFSEVDTWLESVSIRSGIALEAHPDFVIDGEGHSDEESNQLAVKEPAQGARENLKSEESEAKEEAAAHVVHITIDADGRFWIKRDDFAVKLTTKLDTEVSGEDVRVNGDVTIDRGYLQLFGKVFDLSRESQLRFVGSNPPNPVLELEAIHLTRGGTEVSVRITGRANAPELQFLIDGDRVDAGLAVQELFGGEKGGDTGDASNQAQSFVSGLTAGVLATAARRELGAAAPIVMIDPADKAGEGRLRAGFELDDIIPAFLRPIVTGAYLEGIVARESQGEAAANTQFGALLELYFPKNFFAAGQYGPGTTWSVDFGWQL